MKRGAIVTVVVHGDFGKPRPALIVQADAFSDHPSVTVLLFSSTLIDVPIVRVAVDPDASNGLARRSQIMIDRAMTLRRSRVGKVVGQLDSTTMVEVERLLALFLGLAR